MEVIETIVIQTTDVEGKETVVSSVDGDKNKAGQLPEVEQLFIQSPHEARRP